jgi:D-glycero-alpha-D-manno-heptose-7-phosphate kinase
MTAPHPRAQSVVATAPVRIDLAGGWTDVAPYTTEVGGVVCNVAVDLRATARVTSAPDAVAPDAVAPDAVAPDAVAPDAVAPDAVAPDARAAPDDPLARAAWQAAGTPDVAIRLSSSFPVGSGLGGSSAAGVALAAALAAWQHESLDSQALAERSRHTETELLGVPGGCQDHYAAAYGGALLLHCGRTTVVTQVTLSNALIESFERRVMIAYTGESRMSSHTITAVLDAYRAGESETCAALRTMAALAPRMADALRADDLDALGTLLALQWSAQRALHPTITTPIIDAIVADAARAGALGTKALGASGGGCVVVIAREETVDAVRASVGRHAELLPFRVATQGVQVTRGDA